MPERISIFQQTELQALFSFPVLCTFLPAFKQIMFCPLKVFSNQVSRYFAKLKYKTMILILQVGNCITWPEKEIK